MSRRISMQNAELIDKLVTIADGDIERVQRGIRAAAGSRGTADLRKVVDHIVRGRKIMSTNDVPGANPANKDKLAMGCWAEHDDGSLILVESTEPAPDGTAQVVYSMFDVSKKPIAEYRDAMPLENFQRQFSWKPESQRGPRSPTEKWTWHDKTPFPISRVIPEGAQDGVRYASARDQLTAAERVAQSLDLRAHELDQRRARQLRDRISPSSTTRAVRTERILDAFDRFREVLEDELTAADDE